MGSWERRRRTDMAVNHTPILTYSGDKSLQSIKKKYIIYIYIYLFLIIIFIIISYLNYILIYIQLYIN